MRSAYLFVASLAVVAVARPAASQTAPWKSSVDSFASSLRACLKADCDIDARFLGQEIEWQGTFQSIKRLRTAMVLQISFPVNDSLVKSANGTVYTVRCCLVSLRDTTEAAALVPGDRVTVRAIFGPLLAVGLTPINGGEARPLLSKAAVVKRTPN